MNEKQGFIKVLTNLANTGLLDQSLDDEHYQLLAKNFLVIDLMESIIKTPNLFNSGNLDEKFWSKFFLINPQLKTIHDFTEKMMPIILQKHERREFLFNSALNHLNLEKKDILKIMHFFTVLPYQNYDLIKPQQIDESIIKQYISEKEMQIPNLSTLDFQRSIFSHSYLPKISKKDFSDDKNIPLFANMYPYFDDDLRKNKEALLAYLDLNKKISLNIVPSQFLEDIDVLKRFVKYDIDWVNDSSKKEFSFENHELFKLKLEHDSVHKLTNKKYDHAWKNVLNFYYFVQQLNDSDKKTDAEQKQELFFNILQKTKKHHKEIMQQWKNSKSSDDGVWVKGYNASYWNQNILPVIKEFCKVNYDMNMITKCLDISKDKNITKNFKI